MQNKIIVTGGAGFIGSNFILQWLAQEPAAVVNLDLLTYAGNPENLVDVSDHQKYEFVQGDICNRQLVQRILDEHQPRAMVHFGYGRSSSSTVNPASTVAS